jgi:hypothetical protein
MDLYFAGGGSKPGQEEIKRLECNQLLSYGINKSEALKWIEYKRETHTKAKLFIDSGAHSISTGVIQVDEKPYMDEYIKFINDTGDVCDIYAELDVIHDNEDGSVVEDSADRSWENYLYMIKGVKLEYRDKVIPIFHYNEEFSALDRMLEYKHPDTGKHIPYIGLAPRFGNYSVRHAWLTEAFKHIKRSSNPDVKTHAFGCTILRLLEEFPVTSADSATWAISAAFGNVRIGDKTVVVSDRKINQSTNIVNKSAAHRQAVEDRIKENGLTLKELQEDPYLRQVMTIRELKRWEENYKCTYQGVIKNDLW